MPLPTLPESRNTPTQEDTNFATYRAVRRFSSLDGLRAVSILAVLFHHSAAPVDWLPASRLGFLGVDMFFVLSGFLIVTLLLREREMFGRFSLLKFYGR